MKKISILVIGGMMYCLSVLGQQTPINDMVSISLPAGAEKLTKEKLQSAAVSSDSRKSAIDRKKGRGDFYKASGTLIQLNGGNVQFTKDYLEKTKKGFDGMSRMDGVPVPNYRSEIRTINNYRVLIISNEGEDLGHYSFFCVSNTLKCGLNGIIEFKGSEKDKAAAMLDKLLKSISFKK